MIIIGNNGSYEVHKPVADTERYRLYLCTWKKTGQQCLLQIARTIENNSQLDKAAYILQELKRQASELEEEYAQIKEDPKVLLNYDIGFPKLVDSFVCQDQGGRRINILTFKNVEDVRSMVPIQNIVDRDRRCVDLRTSAWIMGKLLKLNAFTHSIGVSIGNFGPTNILLEPNEHYVVIFDCSDAITSDSLPEDVKRANIAQSAKSVIYLLGCDMETKLSMEKITEEMQPYVDMLFYLASVQQSNANIAHQRFYELVDQIWERKFYPFTTIEI